jgi:hypothetical protein
MANLETENPLGIVDKRRGRGVTGTGLTTPANALDVNALRTRLLAVSATAYSTANLDKMTKNDMIYALRLADESAGVA